MGVMTVSIILCDIEFRFADKAGDRQDAAAQTLADHQDIGYDTVMLAREHFAGLAEAGGYFIED